MCICCLCCRFALVDFGLAQRLSESSGRQSTHGEVACQENSHRVPDLVTVNFFVDIF